MLRVPLPRAAVGLAVLGSLSACSVSIGTAEDVSGAKLEASARTNFGDRMPASAEIDCPESLTAVVGATTRCTWTFEDGSVLGMTATVTKVGSKVSVWFENDKKVTSGP